MRMEIEAVMDPIHDDEPQDDRDHLHEIDEILEQIDGCEDETLGDESTTSAATTLPHLFPQVQRQPALPRRKEAPTGLQPQLSIVGQAPACRDFLLVSRVTMLCLGTQPEALRRRAPTSSPIENARALYFSNAKSITFFPGLISAVSVDCEYISPGKPSCRF